MSAVNVSSRIFKLTHSWYSDNAIYDFSKKAVENGLDIFRVFDALNYIGESSSHLRYTIGSDANPVFQTTYDYSNFTNLTSCANTFFLSS